MIRHFSGSSNASSYQKYSDPDHTPLAAHSNGSDPVRPFDDVETGTESGGLRNMWRSKNEADDTRMEHLIIGGAAKEALTEVESSRSMGRLSAAGL